MQAVKAKEIERYGSNHFRVGSCAMQGYRKSMEDAHRIAIGLSKHPDHVFLGVFDGHGGGKASLFCSTNLHKMVDAIDLEQFSEKELIEVVLNLDREFLKESNVLRYHGSTCVFALIDSRPFTEHENLAKEEFQPKNTIKEMPLLYRVTVGNVGDSRCIRGTTNKGEPSSYRMCTTDHVPSLRMETMRIAKAGGFVSSGRVDGDLNLSRAIGDYWYKSNSELPFTEQKISSVPDFLQFTIQRGDWILLACDGIFERLSLQKVTNFVSERLNESQDPGKVASDLCTFALNSGSMDNLTAIVLFVTSGENFVKNESNAEKVFISEEK